MTETSLESRPSGGAVRVRLPPPAFEAAPFEATLAADLAAA
jgi:hypothetical protein